MIRALLLAGALSVLTACSPSDGSLVGAAADKPGVIKVHTEDVDYADDDMPFSTVAKKVTVSMEGDATSAEVIGVFDEYAEEVEGGDVEVVVVTLVGPKQATLSFGGEGSRLAEEVVEDLVAAQGDEAVLTYERAAGKWLRTVNVELAPTDFAEVVRRADRYVDVDDVGVTSGGLSLSRSESTGGDPRVGAARERLVLRIGERFDLLAANVSADIPLEITVAEDEVVAVNRAMKSDPEAEAIGRYRVSSE
ncbi:MULTISPECIES: hypothetical protein [unclassified Nocardioides]|uniref:hypothetical protein n=1 Tax=unclassified Nocardioides TaxID=2615069 RepID=UPI0006FB87DC|nr:MULTISPECIES: hypothetical protein [unclassified Nocardioides]KRA38359.1 hypothetical protein ASD81_06890 [Nocardioides sp. Root614]KRA92318.1 hypothetical protein ASD84_07155 [Nocardioides sp. Root682]